MRRLINERDSVVEKDEISPSVMSVMSVMAKFESVRVAAIKRGLQPDPDLSVWEWADENRVLDQMSSAPGKWRTNKTPYLREIMESLSPRSPIQKVTFMKGAQIGASEAANNFIGAVMAIFNGPMLAVFPSISLAERNSKQRINPMIESTPSIFQKVQGKNLSGKRGDSLLLKDFKGGSLVLAGANSPAGLRNMPVRFLALDEVDAYPVDAGGEGDPVKLAEKRTATFGRRKKIFLISTPIIENESRIAEEFETSDKRYYHVPCPNCGEKQKIEWSNMKWDTPDGNVYLICVHCYGEIHEKDKTKMLEGGEWVASKEGRKNEVGYHLSSLYSPLGWYSWGDARSDFLQAKGKPLLLQGFVNTCLGEVWRESPEEKIEWQALKERCTTEWVHLPDGVLVITMGVDVQGDRLEAEIVGWGSGEQSWSLGYHILNGSPTDDSVWRELDILINAKYLTEDGLEVGVSGVCIDTGYLPDSVCGYVHHRSFEHVYATKGLSTKGKPIVNPPTRTNKWQIPLFGVGTDTSKTVLMDRLKVKEPGPGYCNFPKNRSDEFFMQLTAEKLVVKFRKGILTKSWFKTRTRNEALDCRILNIVALRILNPSGDIQIKFSKKEEDNARKKNIKALPMTSVKGYSQNTQLVLSRGRFG